MIADELGYRHPTEDDHPTVVRAARAWWPTPPASGSLPRLWLRHFSSTCWVAESSEGRLAGFLLGLVAADAPVAHLETVAVDPNLRRRGIGRALVARFVANVRERGVERVEGVVWAGDPAAIAFARALGFRPDGGPGSQRIYGVPAYADYDWEGDDKARLLLPLG
jgi:ribosomal protein S18 acetylase RimI-like enzyme